MKSINCGQILEKYSENKIIYEVKVLDKISCSFHNLRKAIEFIKYHAIAIINLKTNLSLDFLYVNIEKTKHYIIMKRDAENLDEINVHEETYFEYMRTHPQKFSRFAKRRIINDWNLSFPDILRSTINWPVKFSIFLIMLSIFLSITTTVLLIFGLHFIETNKYKINFLTSWMNLFLIYFLLIIPASLLVFNLIQFLKSNKELKKTEGDYLEIDWHFWYKRRIFYMLSNILFALVSLTILSIYIYEDWSIHDYKFEVTIFINLSFWATLLITTITFIFWVKIKEAKILKKYYTKEEVKKFYAWKKNKKLPEIRKVNEKIFIFGSKCSSNITSVEIDKAMNVINKLDKHELRKIKKNDIKELITIKKQYLTIYNEVVNDNISKNNK